MSPRNSPDSITVTTTDTVPGADIDANGSVDVSDLLAVINGWGTCP